MDDFSKYTPQSCPTCPPPSPCIMVSDDLLQRIAAAAEQALQFDDIGPAAGLTTVQWHALVRANPDRLVEYAVSRGRALAEFKLASAVAEHAKRGYVAAARYLLDTRFR